MNVDKIEEDDKHWVDIMDKVSRYATWYRVQKQYADPNKAGFRYTARMLSRFLTNDEMFLLQTESEIFDIEREGDLNSVYTVITVDEEYYKFWESLCLM